MNRSGIASSMTVLIAHSNITSNNSNNSNGGGLYRNGGSFTVQRSIIADNNAASARDCYGTPTFQGINIVESTPGCNPSGTVIQLDPALDPLADNGGPTPTPVMTRAKKSRLRVRDRPDRRLPAE